MCHLRYHFFIYTYHGNQTNWNDKHVKRSAFQGQPATVDNKKRQYEGFGGTVT